MKQEHYKYFRWLAYALEIVIIFVLQQTIGLIPEIYGERPVLLIPVLLTIAMLENSKVGMAFGFIIGLIMDVGYGSVLGYNAMIMTLLGWAIGALAVNLIKTNLFTVMLTSSVSVIVVIMLHFLFFFLFRGYENPWYSLALHYFPRILYTILTTPIIYLFNVAFAMQTNKEQE